MKTFIYSETAIQQLKKKRIRFSFLMHPFIYLTIGWILFISKTMELEPPTAIIFFILIIIICVGVDFYTIKLFETILRQQSFLVSESEIQRIINDKVVANMRKDKVDEIKELEGGILITSMDSSNRLFIPKSLENINELIEDLKRTTGANIS